MTNKIMNGQIKAVIFLLIIFLFFSAFGSAHAVSCVDSNITLSNLSQSVCTYQWIAVTTPTYLSNINITAKGIIINSTFVLGGNSSLNASTLINRGITVLNGTLSNGGNFSNYGEITLEKPLFINFTYFVNEGEIFNKHYINNGGFGNYSFGIGGSYLYSYAGSGGASLQNNSADNGGNTLVLGGEACVLSDKSDCLNVSGNHVTSRPFTYSFNLSILNSAGGADFNGQHNALTKAGSGVFPLIIISKYFANYGVIFNNGQSINYSDVPDNIEALKAGVVGAGGGGVIEAISQNFIYNGTINVSGGAVYIGRLLNSSLNMSYPDSYNLSNLGKGGYGNAFFFNAPNSLLAISLPNYIWPYGNISSYSSPNNPTNVTKIDFNVRLSNPLNCDLDKIYVNLSGISNKSEFTEVVPLNNSDLVLNSTSQNLSLKLFGDNPVLNYYPQQLNFAISNISNNSYLEVPYSSRLPLRFNFAGDAGFGFYIESGGIYLLNATRASNNYTFALEQGPYNLSFYNKTSFYNYTIYNAPNCIGYENFTFYPKSYYLYDGLNISNRIFEGITATASAPATNSYYYSSVSTSCQNLTNLIQLDKQILYSLNTINDSIQNTSYAADGALLERLFNKIQNTAYSPPIQALSSMDVAQFSFNDTGLNLVYSAEEGNVTKYMLELGGSNGTVNINYGGKSLTLTISQKPQHSIMAALEKTFVTSITYIPYFFSSIFRGI